MELASTIVGVRQYESLMDVTKMLQNRPTYFWTDSMVQYIENYY